MDGIKHIIECHCVLPQYRNRKETVYHKFIVFSILDDSDAVVPKHAQCNNCGVIHNVYDVCKSNIMVGREELKSIIDIDDIKLMVPEDIRRVLESYQVELPTWEEVKFILDEKRWGNFVVLAKDTMDNAVHGKRLVFETADKIRIEPFTFVDYVEDK